MTGGGLRGMRIALWCVITATALYALHQALGLKYVQGVIWPTDIYAFQRGVEGHIDVAILGSSRASFDLSPNRMDSCLSERIPEDFQTINLARTFATAETTEQLRSDLLEGERQPDVLVFAVGPEFFNEHNHQLPESMARNSDLRDVPSNLLRVRNLNTFFAALRPLTRGIENLAIYLSRRHESEEHLRWMMLRHGGGQFCYDNAACNSNNKALTRLFRTRWDTVQDMIIPTVREERFSDYAIGEGPIHQHFLKTLQQAAETNTDVVVVQVPFHQSFTDQIPRAVRQQFRTYIETMQAEHQFSFYVSENPNWRNTRSLYTDADHLSAIGSRKLTDEVCKKVIAPLLAGRD